MAHSNSIHTIKQPTIINKILSKAPFFLLTFSLCTIIPIIYVNNEHVIYSWDQASYQDMAIQKALEFREMNVSLRGLQHQASKIYASTVKNYNDYYTVLIAPLLLLFGASRASYILFLSWLYLFPFIVTLGAISSSIVTSNKTLAFRIGVLLSIFTPAVWLPTLNGYPDAGAAFLISLAVLLFVQNMALKSVWRLFAIGACLAFAVLFRRHFAYDVITFFVAVSLIQLYYILTIKDFYSARIKALTAKAFRVSIIGVFMLIILCVFGWPFVQRLMYTSYSTIYASWERTNLTNVSYYLTYYGLIALAISITGSAIALLRSSIVDKAALFILIAGCYSILQWILKVKQIGVHYTLHFTPWIVLGIFMTLWYSLHGLKKYGPVISVSLVSFLVLIFITTLFPFPEATAPADNSTTSPPNLQFPSFPANFPPVKQTNYNEIMQLYSYLKSTAKNKEPIYVAASSGLLNDDMIWHASPDFYKTMMTSSSSETFWKGYELNVLHWTPLADSYDNYPLDELHKAEYIIVTKPFQYHLPINQQKVVHVVVTCFEEGWPFSKDFQLDPKSFTIGDGVTAHIYKRIRPTSLPTLLFTYNQMKAYIQPPPGGKLDWIGLNKNVYYIVLNPQGKTYNVVVENVGKEPVSLIYFKNDGIVNKRIQGDISFSSSKVKSFTIYINKLDSNGNKLEMQERNFKPKNNHFEISLDNNPGEAYSFINMTVVTEDEGGDIEGSKWITIKNLEVM